MPPETGGHSPTQRLDISQAESIARDVRDPRTVPRICPIPDAVGFSRVSPKNPRVFRVIMPHSASAVSIQAPGICRVQQLMAEAGQIGYRCTRLDSIESVRTKPVVPSFRLPRDSTTLSEPDPRRDVQGTGILKLKRYLGGPREPRQRIISVLLHFGSRRLEKDECAHLRHSPARTKALLRRT